MTSSVGDVALHFSTDDLPKRDRLAVWREVFGQLVMRLDIEPLPGVQFRADYTLHKLPGLKICFSVGGGARQSRTRKLLSDGNDNLVLVVNMKGSAGVFQRELEFALGDHQATLMSAGDLGGILRPKTDHRLLSLHMPRTAIAPLLGDTDQSIMRRIPRGAAALQLLIGHIGLLKKSRAIADPLVQPLIVNHVYDLVAASIGATRDADEIAKGRGIRAARLAAIRADVLANLSQPSLSAKTIANRHGLTDRYIHRLFEETELTFSRFVEEERLKRSFVLLTDPIHAGVRIGEIAIHVGFADHSTFNRAFRRRFGDTPGRVRRGRAS